jgi:heptosyltransferase-2
VTTRVLVLAPNWLGDAVLSLPAVAGIRRGLPDVRLAVAARPSVAPLFTMAAGVDEVIALGNARQSVAQLRGRFDLALLMPNSFASAHLVWRAGIPDRWGYRSDLRSLLLTRAAWPPARVHQSDFYRRLVAAFGLPADPGPPVLAVTDAARASGLARLTEAGWDPQKPMVAVAPGAAFGGAKKWPAASYAELMTRLVHDGVQCVLVGSGADRPASDEVRAAVAGDAGLFDLTGQTDLPALAGVLIHCRALVTNDSGAMHVAAALGVHVIAMFGSTNERETAPSGPGQHVVLTHPVWCRPCMLRDCPLTHRCMTGITVDRALTATKGAL